MTLRDATTETNEAMNEWYVSIGESFKNQFIAFVITLSIVIAIMILISIISKGKLFGIKMIIKVAIHCLIGFVLLFVINLIGGMITGGTWSLTPKWYSWGIIGIFGIIGVIFLAISSAAWPGVFVA